MGLQERRYDEDGEGFGRRVGRRFASGFFSWSLPLFTVPRSVPGLAGIHVRMHLLYILVIVGELGGALFHSTEWLRFAAEMMATLFVMVLVHEFGHCLACRWVGGMAEEVLMWPLGGLAFCTPPQRWRAALVTTIGGPAVNVALLPILGGALVATGAPWGLLVFNPFGAAHIVSSSYFASGWHSWLWSAHSMNLMLLVFNMAVPMYPMDGAAMVQELLWARLGYKRSMHIATTVGIVTAIVLGMIGLMFSEMRLIGLAVFGGTTCYNQRRQVAMMEEQPAWAYDTDKGFGAFEKDARPSRPSFSQRRAEKAEARRRQQAQGADAAVDRILDKVRVQGIQSLSARERATLKDATDRSRGGRP